MFLIYGRPGHPASHLVEFFPASTDPQTEYLLVNGALYLQEAVRGDRRVLRPSDRYPSSKVDHSETFHLEMEWGPTMRPRREDLRHMFEVGSGWDYNTVLRAALQIMLDEGDGVPMTFEQRAQRDAIERNPPPTDWNPEDF